MTELTKIEYLIILCFYKLEKNKNIELFTQRFNKYFTRNISAQTILYEVSRFKNIDPVTNNTNAPKNTIHYKLWNEYILQEHIDDLKKLYKTFKSEKMINDEKTVIFPYDYQLDLTSDRTILIEDTPKQIPNCSENQNENIVRDKKTLENALSFAKFLCETKCDNKLFLRKNEEINYTEGHHLIPLKYQSLFDVSLDVEANIISLCPYCHRLLHYGSDAETTLRILYDYRKDRLKKCGIVITFEELLLMYR